MRSRQCLAQFGVKMTGKVCLGAFVEPPVGWWVDWDGQFGGKASCPGGLGCTGMVGRWSIIELDLLLSLLGALNLTFLNVKL